MANQMPYQMYGQSKGTLVPGQTIAVGQFSVQVERYLSQGGFAHVYLVRTATPVYNTTHHVLKRIAVENEAMLAEVKKEVDVMRLLKGHPNIVHLIDAAWHRMSNGTYEVFILMEYCPGGGIIDMMNRRLRERLTEAEILQIFVDVSEGVAYMHSSRPPLLHRDLKVENILQSSPTSFKLCDFGSAATVSPRPPSTAEEIRALEADLNRHTTLQYRAPEMVDLYLRRPVDEKSDVWALGVLLYKLCYYTTPFEEHGPLAILNVQYRTPPYPVYSAQLNALIASMLREHGVHRPTVFEVLDQVHRLRGTKSQFKYNIPPAQPLSPRHSQFKTTAALPTNKPPRQDIASSQSQLSSTSATTTPKNAGVQARELVLEAIAPMRRGRPTSGKEQNDPVSSRQTTPPQAADSSSSKNNWLEEGFDADGEKAWKAIAATKVRETAKFDGDEAWGVKTAQHRSKDKSDGFGDDFGQNLWNSFNPSPGKSKDSVSDVSNNSTSAREPLTPTRTAALAPSNARSRLLLSKSKERDAFDGLGIQPMNKAEPTLGEARKLRTGLAILSHRQDFSRSPQPSNTRPNYLSAQTQPMRGASSSPAPLQPHSASAPPAASPRPPSNQPLSLDLPAESRFPSLEELDASFASGPVSKTPPVIAIRAGTQLSSQLQSQGSKASPDGGDLAIADSLRPSRSPLNHGGSRSAQVTGSAMRGYRNTAESSVDTKRTVRPPETNARENTSPSESVAVVKAQKSGKTPSSTNFTGLRANTMTSLIPTGTGNGESKALSETRDTKTGTKDWLTGTDSEQSQSSHPSSKAPALRASPTKRSSYMDSGGSRFTKLNDVAIRPERSTIAAASDPPQLPIIRNRLPSAAKSKGNPLRPTNINTTDSQYRPSAEPLSDNWSPLPATSKTVKHDKEAESQSSADDEEGPEDAGGYARSSTLLSEPQKSRHKPRQSSVHDLVDLWGGGISDKERKKDLNPPPSLDLGRLSPPKRASVSLNSPATTSFQRSTSPKPLSSLESRPAPKGLDFTGSRPQPSPTVPTPSPVSARSRPQSMFLFPSRSTDASSSGLPSPGVSASLSPPADTPRRPARRTSISDMVQHYEAINKSASLGLGPPPVAAKPLEMRSPVNARKLSYDTPTNQPTMSSTSPSEAAPSEPLRKIETLQPPSQPTLPESTQGRRSPISVARTSSTGRQPEPEEAQPRDGEFLSKYRKPIPLLDETSQPVNGSPPDKPYQGVGRLIDQWQRKTAEREGTAAPAIPRRGGFAAKRPAVVTSPGRS